MMVAMVVMVTLVSAHVHWSFEGREVVFFQVVHNAGLLAGSVGRRSFCIKFMCTWCRCKKGGYSEIDEEGGGSTEV